MCCCIAFSFFIHSSIDRHLGWTYISLLWTEQQWTWLRKCLCSSMKPPLGICAQVLYLDLEVDVSPASWRTPLYIRILASGFLFLWDFYVFKHMFLHLHLFLMHCPWLFCFFLFSSTLMSLAIFYYFILFLKCMLVS